jgi:multicomponent Na+:H+ antiporter subunit D
MVLAMGLAAFACIFIGVFPQPLYNLLPFTVDYIPYTGAHVVGQLQLLMFGALAFALLILSGYYPPEIKSINLDVDWTYRKLGTAVYKVLDTSLNTANRRAEAILMTGVKGGSGFFRQITVHLVLFFSVNLWLLQGYRDKHLALKKQRLYDDVVQGTLPVGIGAAVAVSFVVLIYVLT